MRGLQSWTGARVDDSAPLQRHGHKTTLINRFFDGRHRHAPDAPTAPPYNPHTFAHAFEAYVRGARERGKVTKQPTSIRPRVSVIYEGRLIGLDVEAQVSMQVVHTNCPTKGCGRITKVSKRAERKETKGGGLPSFGVKSAERKETKGGGLPSWSLPRRPCALRGKRARGLFDGSQRHVRSPSLRSVLAMLPPLWLVIRSWLFSTSRDYPGRQAPPPASWAPGCPRVWEPSAASRTAMRALVLFGIMTAIQTNSTAQGSEANTS